MWWKLLHSYWPTLLDWSMHLVLYSWRSFPLLAVIFTLTGQTDSVISTGRCCVEALNHCENGRPVCYVPPFIHSPFFPFSLSIPTVHFSTHPHPPFSQYGPAQTVGSNPYGTMVTANIMCRISKERESERCSKVKRHFLPGSWCRKVISVVMYSCLGNIRFLTERQTNHDREEEEEATGKLMKKRERTMRRGCWVWMKSLTLALLADSWLFRYSVT